MLLGVFPKICFEFLRILEENRKKGKPEILGKHGPLLRRVGNPRRGDSSTLWRIFSTPQRSTDVAVLRCGVDTVH